MAIRNHQGNKYLQLTKNANPVAGEQLYRLPQPEDGDIGPITCTVTDWGADNHGEKDHYLIEVISTLPTDFIAKITAKYGKEMAKEESKPRREFLPLECLYKKIQ